jgi:hypothetical protein
LHRRQAAQAFGANEQQALFDDKTLDDYCYEFLEENEVQRRNGDQVFSRYSKRLEKKMMGKQKDQLPNEEDRRNSGSQQTQNAAPSKYAKMVVVSQFWVWLLGGAFHCPHNH